MPGNSNQEENDDLSQNVVAVASNAKSLAEKILADVSTRSATQQACVGGASGWVAGYMLAKVGKMAALTVGGFVIVAQVASHRGYISINWNRVAEIRKEVTEEAEEKLPWLVHQAKTYFKRNKYFTGSFAGGFLIGLAMS